MADNDIPPVYQAIIDELKAIRRLLENLQPHSIEIQTSQHPDSKRERRGKPSKA